MIYSVVLTNPCNMRSHKLKALSIVHSTCLKISLKRVVQAGPKDVNGIII